MGDNASRFNHSNPTTTMKFQPKTTKAKKPINQHHHRQQQQPLTTGDITSQFNNSNPITTAKIWFAKFCGQIKSHHHHQQQPTSTAKGTPKQQQRQHHEAVHQVQAYNTQTTDILDTPIGDNTSLFNHPNPITTAKS